MRVYELANNGCETITCLPELIFQEDGVIRSSISEKELKLEYGLENMPFEINRSAFSILLQDIHNNIPCGILFVSVPICEDFDTITYIVRFDEKEFEKIKKICLTNFPK